MGRETPWCSSVEETLEDFDVKLDVGLTDEQVEERRKEYGLNELEKQPGTPLWKLVLAQFDDTLVKILLLAAMISLALAMMEGDEEEGLRAYIEPAVILLILVLNAIVGVWQESNAEAALEALKEMQSEHARVRRNGVMVNELPATELVPGDIVTLQVGDKVPADLRMMVQATATVRAEQASLTGESVAVSKTPDAVNDADAEIQSKECMLFAGTAIANGGCTAVVTHIGMKTEMGKIQSQIQAAAEEEDDTPLKKRLDEFGNRLAQVIAVVCLVVWLINYKNFLEWDSKPGSWAPDLDTVQFSIIKCTYYFKIAVALAVAAIPEGLPAVITTCLALGTRKMAARNAIVRRLNSVETLGCTTVICSDKTGTLTTNQMSAVHLVGIGAASPRLREYEVSGVSYDPDAGRVEGLEGVDKSLAAFALASAVCNESSIDATEGPYKCIGAPTEAALLVLADKIFASTVEGEARKEARKADRAAHAMSGISEITKNSPKLAILEFDRLRKSMSVVAGSESGNNVLYVKGAAECVLERCTEVMLETGRITKLTAPMRKNLLAAVDGMAARALRCLAVAQKTDIGGLKNYDGDVHHPAHVALQDPAKYEGIESDLCLLGLAGLQDPPRPEVADSIRECAAAGISVTMITGDNKATAEAIARNIGIFAEDADLDSVSMTGRSFMGLNEEDQVATLAAPGGKVFSRAEPIHKQQIVRLLKTRLGEVAAMTGDGVNDAPALKLADIGVAMGITGTEVAKEASDMVLADDNFATIVHAVEEGRSIYNNMKAFIRYMISSNIGEVVSIFLTAALGLPEGLIPVQLLWVNLVTDGPPATALGFNPPDKNIMGVPPRDANEPLITRWAFVRYMVVGIYVGAATVGAFAVWFLCDSFMGIDLSADGHTTISWSQLTNWDDCTDRNPADGFGPDFAPAPFAIVGGTVTFNTPCDYFDEGKVKASTLSLSVLVAIEMFNALNALSEDASLLTTPPWANLYLLAAMAVSFSLHCLIMYVPFLATIFSIVPLNWNEWLLVLLFASPVLLIDEALKLVGRNFFTPRRHMHRTASKAILPDAPKED